MKDFWFWGPQYVAEKTLWIGFTWHRAIWFKNGLTESKQFFNINRISSNLQSILVRVPHGSILDPLLFLIYINDLLISGCTILAVLYCLSCLGCSVLALLSWMSFLASKSHSGIKFPSEIDTPLLIFSSSYYQYMFRRIFSGVTLSARNFKRNTHLPQELQFHQLSHQ